MTEPEQPILRAALERVLRLAEQSGPRHAGTVDHERLNAAGEIARAALAVEAVRPETPDISALHKALDDQFGPNRDQAYPADEVHGLLDVLSEQAVRPETDIDPERLARALVGTGFVGASQPWNELPDEARRVWLDEAADVIAAYRATPLAERRPETEDVTRMAAALQQTLNALALTYTNVENGQRPHWCRHQPPRAVNGHERTCAGMLHVQDEARAALRSDPVPFYCLDCNEVLPIAESDEAGVRAHLAADLASPTR